MWEWEHVSFPGTRATMKNVLRTFEKICGLTEKNLLININQSAKALYPIYFGGLKFNINKVMSESLLYNSQINLDTSGQITNYKSYNRFINREPLIYPSTSSTPGFFNLTFNSYITSALKCIVFAHFLPEGGGGLDCILNYFDEEFTGSVSIAHKNVSFVEITANYLQAVNQRLSVGAEVVSEIGKTSLKSKFTIAGKYIDNYHNIIISGSIGTKGTQLCLFKTLCPKISVGSIVDYMFDEKSTLASVACQWTEDVFIFRCSVDTNQYMGLNILRSIYIDENVHVNINWATFTNLVDELKVGIGLDFFIKN